MNTNIIDRFNNNMDSMKRKIIDLNNENPNAKKIKFDVHFIKNICDDHTESSNIFEKMYNGIEELKVMVNNLNIENNIKTNQISNLQNESTIKTNQISNLQNESTIKTNQISNLQNENATKTHQITHLQNDISYLENQNNIKTKQISYLQSENITKTDQIQKLNAEKLLLHLIVIITDLNKVYKMILKHNTNIDPKIKNIKNFRNYDYCHIIPDKLKKIKHKDTIEKINGFLMYTDTNNPFNPYNIETLLSSLNDVDYPIKQDLINLINDQNFKNEIKKLILDSSIQTCTSYTNLYGHLYKNCM